LEPLTASILFLIFFTSVSGLIPVIIPELYLYPAEFKTVLIGSEVIGSSFGFSPDAPLLLFVMLPSML